MKLEEVFALFTLFWISQGYAYFLANDIDPIMGYEPDAADAKTYPKREFSHMHKKYFTGSNVIKFQKKDHEDIVDSHFKLLKPKTLRTPKDYQYNEMNLGLADMNEKSEKMVVVTNAAPPPLSLQQMQQVQLLQAHHQQPLQVGQAAPVHSLQTVQQVHSITASPYNPAQSQPSQQVQPPQQVQPSQQVQPAQKVNPSQQVQPKQTIQTHQLPAQQKHLHQEDKNPPVTNRRIHNLHSTSPQQSIQLNTNVLSEQKKFIRQNYMPNIVRPTHGRYGTIKPSIERIARHDQMFPKMDFNKDSANFENDFASFYRVPSQFAQGNLDQHDYGNSIFVGSFN